MKNQQLTDPLNYPNGAAELSNRQQWHTVPERGQFSHAASLIGILT